VKVYRRNGEETWVLIHIEIQSSKDPLFEQRMWVYHYRIWDRFRRPLASLAILADDIREWRPDRYQADLWGCQSRLVFPTVKLIDYEARLGTLESSPNPFALVVLAHLRTLRTHSGSQARLDFKLHLVKSLYARNWTRAQVADMFRILDWLLNLSKSLQTTFWTELHRRSLILAHSNVVNARRPRHLPGSRYENCYAREHKTLRGGNEYAVLKPYRAEISRGRTRRGSATGTPSDASLCSPTKVRGATGRFSRPNSVDS
jgi:hypothetical protein